MKTLYRSSCSWCEHPDIMTQKQHNNDEHSDLRKKKPLLSYVDVYVEASYVIIKITTLYRNVVNSLV